MRILAVSDEEVDALWEYYQPGRLAEYDLILSAGDLKNLYTHALRGAVVNSVAKPCKDLDAVASFLVAFVTGYFNQQCEMLVA